MNRHPSVHLHHLTGDNSWLIAFIDDENSVTLLLDPWFTEPDVQVHRLWLRQAHPTSKQPQFSDFQSLKEFLAAQNRQVDGIIITFGYSDHLHRPTIDGVDEDVPFFAFRRAAKILRTWGRKHVHEIEKEPASMGIVERIVEADNRANRVSRRSFLEKLDVRLSFLPTTAPFWEDFAQGYLHGSLTFVFSKLDSSEGKGAIIYSPHGTPVEDLKTWTTRRKSEDLELFALVAGWNVVKMPWLLGGVINFGSPKNVEVVQLLSPRYWLRTHDEITTMSGFVSMVLKRELWTKERVESETRMFGSRTKVLDMEPGETLALPLAFNHAEY
ncbi:hypothetical protein E1B28_001697 [Marasmius oreades]|uniref:Uncharacterized protein n=1 Tax=Marasmius oreades TaxID=181124 RepID=A0A9P8AFF8_9AGAR|nr:uncharacterized protein E1B28_001697 [Marasmius oreades]KAG7099896.1 hypothetical protein E1B28_001697 [Marasmius oreades]